MKGDSIDIKEDKVVPDRKQRLDYILWLTIFYYFLNAHINITYVGAIIINAHCTYTMCVHVHVHVWICAWIADLPSVSNKSSAPTCTKNYDTK